MSEQVFSKDRRNYNYRHFVYALIRYDILCKGSRALHCFSYEYPPEKIVAGLIEGTARSIFKFNYQDLFIYSLENIEDDVIIEIRWNTEVSKEDIDTIESFYRDEDTLKIITIRARAYQEMYKRMVDGALYGYDG